jgi:4-amino-4-deoxychorismate lyase
MFLLFESICVIDGEIQSPLWHEQRYKSAFHKSYNQLPKNSLLEGVLIPEKLKKGKVKLRISYNQFEKKIEGSKYTSKEIKTLQIIESNSINYSLKYKDRKNLDQLFLKRNSCDDIIILKNGLVTDSSYGNLVFFKNEIGYTPEEPLLKGTRRAKLLHEKKILSKKISVTEIKEYEFCQVINALLDLNESDKIPVDKICF